MRKTIYAIEILGIITVMTGVLVLACVTNHDTGHAAPQQVTITGALG